jgi:hypothetical protein
MRIMPGASNRTNFCFSSRKQNSSPPTGDKNSPQAAENTFTAITCWRMPSVLAEKKHAVVTTLERRRWEPAVEAGIVEDANLLQSCPAWGPEDD